MVVQLSGIEGAPVVRYAVPEDAGLIAGHRHRMFADNAVAAEDVLTQMDAAFLPWVLERLRDGRYVGVLAEEQGSVMAGAGVFLGDFPPHWRQATPVRAYVLNVYTEPAFRGRGLARLLMEKVLEECRRRGVVTVVLHASPQGRRMYDELGFFATDEMMLMLGGG